MASTSSNAVPTVVAVTAQPQMYTATIASSARKKHVLLPHLEVFANYPLHRVYQPSSLANLQPRDGLWVRIRPLDPALHDEALKLSWTVNTSSTVMAQQLVGNPFSKHAKHHLPRVKLRDVDAASPAGVALAAIKAVVHPYMQKQASDSLRLSRKRAGSSAAAAALVTRQQSGGGSSSSATGAQPPAAQRQRTEETAAPTPAAPGVFGGHGNFVIHAATSVMNLMSIIVTMMMTLRRFFFARGLPFAAVEDPWLAQYTQAAIAFGRAGGRMATPEEMADPNFSPTPGLVFALPKAQALAGKHLDEEMEIAQEYAKTHRLGPDGVDKAGVSCTSDGAEINGKPTYNICFVSRHGPIYAGVYDLDVKGVFCTRTPSLSLSLALTDNLPPPFSLSFSYSQIRRTRSSWWSGSSRCSRAATCPSTSRTL